MKHFFLIFLASVFFIPSVTAQVPNGFGYIAEEIPSIELEIRYASKENFMGKVVDGYASPKIVLTRPTLKALKKAQADFNHLWLGIILFDAYRPQRAVDDFMAWVKIKGDTLMKRKYYPHLTKDQLVPQGYIAEKSGHSRGSTVDLSLIFLKGEKRGQQLDMGGIWDFFGQRSNQDFPHLSPTQKKNRRLLKRIMQKNGFSPYSQEWWHFTLVDEPFPEQYFNF